MRANSTSAISRPGIAGDIAAAGSISVLVRMSPKLLNSLDEWIADDTDISRPSAIRQLVEFALTPKPHAFCLSAEKAAEIGAWAKENAPSLSLHEAIAKLIEIGLRAKK